MHTNQHYNFSQSSFSIVQVHDDWLMMMGASACENECACMRGCVWGGLCACICVYLYVSLYAWQVILWFWMHMDSSRNYTCTDARWSGSACESSEQLPVTGHNTESQLFLESLDGCAFVHSVEKDYTLVAEIYNECMKQNTKQFQEIFWSWG